jgi:hypothetical protein
MRTGYWAKAIMVTTWHATAVIAALTIGVAAVPVDGQPRAGVPAMICTNPFSGATWRISIDHDRSTVDSNPAQISEASITWQDAKDGGHYTLDLGSGDLTVIVASSTGGYFLHDHCRPPP